MLHRLKAPELVVRDPVGTEVGPSLPAGLVAALGERGGDGSPALAADRFTVHVADGVAGPSRAVVGVPRVVRLRAPPVGALEGGSLGRSWVGDEAAGVEHAVERPVPPRRRRAVEVLLGVDGGDQDPRSVAA